MSLRSRSLSLLALAVAAVSCESSTRPSDLVADYALVMVAGEPVPAPFFDGSSGIIVADTVRLLEGGRGEEILAWRDTGSTVITVSHHELTWSTSGDRLEVSFHCDDTAFASCVAPPHLAGAVVAGKAWVLDRPGVRVLPAAFNRVGTR